MSGTVAPINGGQIDIAALAAHPDAVLHEPQGLHQSREAHSAALTTNKTADDEVVADRDGARRPSVADEMLVHGAQPVSGHVAQGGDDTAVLPPPSNPMAVSRELVAARFSDGSTDFLLAWRGGFYGWDGRCWRECHEAAIRTEAYRFLEHAKYEVKGPFGPMRLPWEPTRSKIANVLEALRAVTHLSDTIEPPAWLAGEGPDPHELVVTANGILHVSTRELLPHDSRLFVEHAVPFAFDPGAPEPRRWLSFLRELWDDDDASIALAQEMAGYVVSGDTSLQKILLLVGPTRAGKGVFANVLSSLVGRYNVGAPTLAGLTTNFGLQGLIGKTLAVVSDARLGPKANVAALAERMLSISGEDAITIDRKYRVPWTGPLGVRFLLLTNELPRFSDASGALAKRFVVLVLQRSFYGREDPTLFRKILPELPGILNWALNGLDRLRAQGHFSQPASAREATRELEDLASPMAAFLRDLCIVGLDQYVAVDELWATWKAWCEDQSQYHGTKQTFGRDLRAAIPGLRMGRPRDDDEQRHRVYVGVGLRTNNAPDRGPRGPEDSEPEGGPHGPRSRSLLSQREKDAEAQLGGFDGLAVEDDYPGSAFDGIEGNTPAPDAGSASPGGKP
jgi:putative DNA primase/helicase